MGLRITRAYRSGDKPALRLIIEEVKRLYNDVLDLHANFTALWHKTSKPIGLGRIDIRYGGLLMRIKAAQKRLEDYADGVISSVEELEAERLMFGGDAVKPGKSLVDWLGCASVAIP
jgi:hypothetical protein